jgi:hypothetical protein
MWRIFAGDWMPFFDHLFTSIRPECDDPKKHQSATTFRKNPAKYVKMWRLLLCGSKVLARFECRGAIDGFAATMESGLHGQARESSTQQSFVNRQDRTLYKSPSRCPVELIDGSLLVASGVAQTSKGILVGVAPGAVVVNAL